MCIFLFKNLVAEFKQKYIIIIYNVVCFICNSQHFKDGHKDQQSDILIRFLPYHHIMLSHQNRPDLHQKGGSC